MNEQKSTNFFIDPRTNWKYILIVLVLAFFVGGGILGYQWWTSTYEVKFLEEQVPEKAKEEKEVSPTEEFQTQQKIIVTTDKTEYERDDILKYTIINNSSSIIFPILSDNKRIIELQEYNYDNKKWEPPQNYKLVDESIIGYDGYFPVFLVFNENPIGPISILSKEGNNLPLNKVLNQFNDKIETYRLVFLYYGAKSKSWLNENWEEIKIAISNKFTVKGTILAEDATARSFCLERYKENDLYLESVRFLNFDSDEDKEIIGLCWKGEYDKKGLLFVLDKQNNQYKSVLEKEGETYQRYYTFENLKTNDVDGDGIDEIIYEEEGWYIAGGRSYLHLYSPKYQEWFYRDNWWEWDETNGTRKEGVKLSPNLDLEKYKVFKEFLLKQ